MQLTLTEAGARRGTRVSSLARLNAAALAGVTLALCYLAAAFFGFDTISAAIIGLCLACAALNFTGWRWAALPGILPGAVIPALFGSFLLRDPGAPSFLPGLLLVGSGALVAISALAATVQNYRQAPSERGLPGWIFPALILIAGLISGAELSALAPRPALSAGVSPEVLAGLPSLSGRDFAFSQTEIRARVGETVALRLENSDPEAHSFDIDALNVHAPIRVGQTGLALFKPSTPGKYIFYCAPHYNKATGEGMHGTLIVEP